jgi:hypothetical protein
MKWILGVVFLISFLSSCSQISSTELNTDLIPQELGLAGYDSTCMVIHPLLSLPKAMPLLFVSAVGMVELLMITLSSRAS